MSEQRDEVGIDVACEDPDKLVGVRKEYSTRAGEGLDETAAVRQGLG